MLDIDRHRYRNSISDIAGLDVEEHNGNIPTAITVVRNWLRQASNIVTGQAPSGAAPYARYQAFRLALPATCNELKYDVSNLSFADYSWAVYDWIKNNP
jgi:hypothetical protein